jgi:hypothetical protein
MRQGSLDERSDYVSITVDTGDSRRVITTVSPPRPSRKGTWYLQSEDPTTFHKSSPVSFMPLRVQPKVSCWVSIAEHSYNYARCLLVKPIAKIRHFLNDPWPQYEKVRISRISDCYADVLKTRAMDAARVSYSKTWRPRIRLEWVSAHLDIL